MKTAQPSVIVAASILLLSGLIGCRQKNTFVQPPPPQVTVAKPEKRDVTIFMPAPGRLEARDAVDIRARVLGYIEKVMFDDGEFVEAGQQLFQIERAPYEAALKAAEARLSSAKAALGIAQTNYDRRQQAYKTRAVSEIDVLTARANLDSAKAEVLAAEAAVTQAKIDLSYTDVRSPVSGRASRRLVSVGNLVGGGEPTLLTTVVVQDPIHAYFNVSERVLVPKLGDLARLEENDMDSAPEVFLELADGSRYPHPGRIDFVDNRADQTTGTVTVRARFPNPDSELLPGLYGRVLIPEKTENAILVPDLAIQRDIGGPFVLIVNDENKVEARYVTLGQKADTDRIIKSGLDGTENVIVAGLQRARPGIEVTTTVQTAETATDAKEASAQQ
ncbi:MAG: efflux RND transporter periplasmic adaptor subunit [Verrucomicrobia bacterium]|nr:MAG: efflux RND transporter periplasmic adaptor subunit [Verrucomicrobiota bacterium]